MKNKNFSKKRRIVKFLLSLFLIIYLQTSNCQSDSVSPTRSPTAIPTRSPTYNPTVSAVTSGVITSHVGNGSCGFSEGYRESAMVNNPYDVWVDSNGNLFIADEGNNRVRLVSQSGVVTTIAGTGAAGYTCDNSLAVSCALNGPRSVSADTNNNLFISDTDNQRIRRVDGGTRIITTIAGRGVVGLTGNNGPATSALINNPGGLFVTTSGLVYFADMDNQMIRVIDLNSGMISVFAGTGTRGSGGDGGFATLADLNDPKDIWVNTKGTVFIADMNNNKVRAVDGISGMISTFAGTGAQSPVIDGVNATQSALYNPVSITGDEYNNVYVFTLSTNTVRRIDGLTGKTYLYAGSGEAGYGGDTIVAKTAKFNQVYGMFAFPTLVLADSGNCRVRKIVSAVNPTVSPTLAPTSPTVSPTLRPSNPTYMPSSGPSSQPSSQPSAFPSSFPSAVPTNNGTRKPSLRPTRSPTARPSFSPSCNPTVASTTRGVIVSIAGNGTCGFGSGSGPALGALVNKPHDIWVSYDGRYYLADRSNHRIRYFSSSGTILNDFAGSGLAGYDGDGGIALYSKLNYPGSVTGDSNGNIYISDSANYRIRQVRSSIITTVVGIGTPGSMGNNGPATSALINNPGGLFVTSTGILYFADMENRVVRAVNLNTGIITLFAGTGTRGSGGDGINALTAELGRPTDVWVNTMGNVLITDMMNHKVRMVSVQTGIISTYAGTGSGSDAMIDGLNATQSIISTPLSITGDQYNNVYVFSLSTYTVQRIDGVSGEVYRYAGSGLSGYSGDVIAATSARFEAVYGLGITADSSLLIPDSDNCRVRKVISAVNPTTPPTIAPTSPTASPTQSPTNPTSRPSTQPSGVPSLAPSTLPTVHTALPTSRPSWPIFVNPNITEYPSSRPSAVPSPHPSPVPTQVPTVLVGRGAVISLVGNGTCGFRGDGEEKEDAQLNNPYDVWVDSLGRLFLTDKANSRIRMVSVVGIITTIAGTNVAGYNGDGRLATVTALYQPRSAGGDSNGNIFISDTMNQRIRKVDATTRLMSTIAGTGIRGNTGNDGPATSASLKYPSGLFVTSLGMLYFADTNNQMIRAVNLASGVIQLIAGTGSFGRSGDGRAATLAKLATPSDVWLNTKGDVFIADTNNNRVRVISGSTSIISTYAGTGSMVGEETNGVNATQSIVLFPISLVGDTLSNLYIFSTGSYTIRRVDYETKIITAYAGLGLSGYSGDQIAATAAMFTEVNGLGIDLNSDVLVPDARNCRVRKVYTVSDPTSLPSSQPSNRPTSQPTRRPTSQPTRRPTAKPSGQPSSRPTLRPSGQPSRKPSAQPSAHPTTHPSSQPTSRPISEPSSQPSSHPSVKPSAQPTANPFATPTSHPSVQPSAQPSSQPVSRPTSHPSTHPTSQPTEKPSNRPSTRPSNRPSEEPSGRPSAQPISFPSRSPSSQPTSSPTCRPISAPTSKPSGQPTFHPTRFTEVPTASPSVRPPSWTYSPTFVPSISPTLAPSASPTDFPTSCMPSFFPTIVPTQSPSTEPSFTPSTVPSYVPSCIPTPPTTLSPTGHPSSPPSSSPSSKPSCIPSSSPSLIPTTPPTTQPSSQPSVQPSSSPSAQPSITPTTRPSSLPSLSPFSQPTGKPSNHPSAQPISTPSSIPTVSPTLLTASPTPRPTSSPTLIPTLPPSAVPTSSIPSRTPSQVPSVSPTTRTNAPSFNFLTNGTLLASKAISVVPYTEKFRQSLFLFGDLTSSVTAFDNVQLSDPSVGSSFLILGQSGTSSLPSSIDLTGSVDFNRFYPLSNTALSQDTSVRSVSVLKDINNDGFNDLIIGDPLQSKAYVLFGKAIGLVGMTQGFTIYGETVNDYLGWSVSSLGDVNGDGFNDLVTCGLVASTCYVIYGRSSGFSNIYLANTLSLKKGFTITSSYIVPGGMAVSDAGDFNGDGVDDLAVSVTGTSSVINFVFVIFGKASSVIQNIELTQFVNGVDGVRIVTPTWSFAGLSLSGGFDYNHDGYDDIVIGSIPYNKGYTTQMSYVVYGKATSQLTQDITLSSLTSTQGFRISGAGFIVNGEVGDVNGDGFDDIVVVNYPRWAGQNGVYTLLYPDPVSSAPSMYPSSSPSAASEAPISASPSYMRSAPPSAAPSNPTALPTEAPSGPTVSPTRQPTTPTATPTKTPSAVPTFIPTVRPSRAPTAKPTTTAVPSTPPTRAPTIRPTMKPSLKPTRSPTIRPTVNLNPSSQPTSQPTVSAQNNFSTIFVDQGGNYSILHVSRKTQYIITADSNTFITSHSFVSKYVLSQAKEVTTTITNFHPNRDLIDLTSFSDITTFGQLSYSNNPLILLFPDGQKLVLSSLLTINDLQEKNFIFASATKSNTDDNAITADPSTWSNELITVTSALVGMLIFTVLFYRCIENSSVKSALLAKRRRSISNDEESQKLLANTTLVSAPDISEEEEQRESLLSPLLHEIGEREAKPKLKSARKSHRKYAPPPSVASEMLIPSSSSSSAASLPAASSSSEDEESTVDGVTTIVPKKKLRGDFGPTPIVEETEEAHSSLFDFSSPRRNSSAKGLRVGFKEDTYDEADDDEPYNDRDVDSLYSMFRTRTHSENPSIMWSVSSSSSRNKENDISDRSESDENSSEKQKNETTIRSKKDYNENDNGEESSISAFTNHEEYNEEFFMLPVDDK